MRNAALSEQRTEAIWLTLDPSVHAFFEEPMPVAAPKCVVQTSSANKNAWFLRNQSNRSNGKGIHSDKISLFATLNQSRGEPKGRSVKLERYPHLKKHVD